jgi:hypothetical protein
MLSMALTVSKLLVLLASSLAGSVTVVMAAEINVQTLQWLGLSQLLSVAVY